MSAGVPIVFIHNGNSDYLFPTFYQLKAFNAQSDAYLIGDSTSKHYEPWVKHVFLKEYIASSIEFAKQFINLSTLGADYELFCIQRWFVLRDFMKAQKLDKVIYLDSDVLVYDDLTAQQKRFNHAGMTICHISGHTNFVSKLSVLEEFCDYITQLYSTSIGRNTLNDWLLEFRKTQKYGGISDMILIRKFAEANPDKVADINFIYEGTDFDLSYRNGEYMGYEETQNPRNKIDKCKKISWLNNQPYANNLSTNQSVRMITLHFQGNTKPLIFDSAYPKGADFNSLVLKFKFIYNFQRFLRKIKSSFKINR